MLVKLRRNWFGPNGVQYRTQDGIAEISKDLRDQLPPDAMIISEDDMKFDTGKPKLPGFGAKPAHELVLDEIPGAAPTHMIIAAAGETGGPKEPDDLTPEQEKALTPEQRKTRAEAQKKFDEAVKAEQKSAGIGLKRAEEKAKKVEDKKLDL